jgi:iron complex outermembrane recepter protein
MKTAEPNAHVRRVVRAVLTGVSTLTLGAVATPLSAQQASAPQASTPAPSDELQEVVITGLKASLQKSLDIKEQAVGIIDAISAEDIGQFPDSNVAEALQRVPGVSVSRGSVGIGGVPTSTGDATEITVRGFGPQFNETLFDGRQAAEALGRSYNFATVGSDYISQIDVLKTPDSTLSSGAIGATINIHYPKPFDHPGLQASVEGGGTYSPEDGKAGPTGGFLVSDTFADNTFGVLADVDYTDYKTRGDHVNIQGWEGSQLKPCQLAGAAACVAGSTNAANTASITDWFIQDYGIYREFDDDARTDARLVVQWRPADGVTMTLNDDYSNDKLVQTQYGYSVWFNNGSLTDVTLNPNGTATSFVQPNTPTDFQGQINGAVIQSNEFGFNLLWDVGAHQHFIFDADQSESKLNPGGQLSSIDSDVGYGPSSPGGTNGNNVGIAGVGSNSLPYPTNYGPNGNEAMFINNGLIGSHVLPMESSQNSNIINQFKLQGEWAEDRVDLKYGLQYVMNKEELVEYDSFVNNDWQAYSGYGPASNNPGGVALPQSFFNGSFSTGPGFINGFSNGGLLPPNILAFNPYQVLNYLQGLGNPQTTNIPGANKTCCTPPFTGVYMMGFNNGDYQQVDENTLTPYLNLMMKESIANMPLTVNMGVRDERTVVSSAGLGQLPTSLTVQSSDHTAFLVAYTNTTPIYQSNSYRYLLPNLDLNLQVTDDLKLRFDASRTLTRPPLNLITPDLNVSQGQRVGSLVATGGNPDLLPYKSDNLDLGAEWYYAQNSYVAVDAFLKDVSDFIVGGTVEENINNVVDPTTGKLAEFAVTSQVNGPSAEVRGLELALQHMFWDTGFGVQANGTWVGTNRPYDPNNITTSGFAITGLANSANFVGFYDKYGFQARVAVNWRGEYLDHFGQQQNNSAYGTEPTFVNANTEVDFSAQYDFLKHYSVYFEAINLNDSTYSTHGRFPEQVLDVIDTGRRFILGFRAKL